MTGIQDWDRVALPALDEAGPPSASESQQRVELDQFDAPMARAWINDAAGLGLIGRIEGSGKPPRYALTEKGRSQIDQ